MSFSGKTLVIGAGKSGLSSARLLARNEKAFGIYDGNPDLTVSEIVARAPELDDSFPLYTEKMTDTEVATFDRVVVSPGVPLDQPIVKQCLARGLELIGEIELAYRFAKGRIIGITGTNGKTTTTTLVGELMKRAYEDVYVVGNIGLPFTDIADRTTENSVIVIELSSFQLETISEFHVTVGSILNLTPDHLDRHGTMEAYAAAKERIANRATATDVCVLNADNAYTADFAGRFVGKAVCFSSQKELEQGLFLRKDRIIFRKDTEEHDLMDVQEMHLVGTCNAENVMAAIAMGDAMGISLDELVAGVKAFQAVEHRIEYVTTKRGIRFYNDSKGTNPDAAIQGIKAMDAKTCLIAGGYDKKIPFDEWILAFGDKVKKLVLIGQTAELIAETAKKYGFHEIVFADSLEEAIDVCYETACEGECVLLSPACASWGMFPNYETRGNLFKEYVRNLKE